MRFEKSAALLLLSIVMLLAIEFLLFDYTVDDIWIMLRHSLNFATGHGAGWNPDDPDPTESYSTFSWFILAAFAYLINADAVLFLKFIGIASSIANLVLTYLIATNLTKDKILGAGAAAFLSIIPAYSLWAVTGLETQLATLFFLLGIYFLSKNNLSRKTVAMSATAFCLMALTNIMGWLVSALFFLYIIMKKEYKMLPYFLVPYVLLFLPVLAWRWMYYGYPLPNSFYFKATGLNLIHPIISALYLLPFIAFAALSWKEALGKLRPLAVVVFLWFLLSAFTNDIMMVPIRFFIPVLPIIIIFSAIGLWKAVDYANRRTGMAKILLLLVIIFVLMNPVQPVGRMPLFKNPVYSLPEEVASMELNKELFRGYGKVATWISENSNENDVIALSEGGYLPFHMNRTAVDLSGLADKRIAHNGFSTEYLDSRKPRYIILLGNSSDVSTSYTETFQETLIDTEYFKEKYSLVKSEFIISHNFFKRDIWLLIFERIPAMQAGSLDS